MKCLKYKAFTMLKKLMMKIGPHKKENKMVMAALKFTSIFGKENLIYPATQQILLMLKLNTKIKVATVPY